jgi:hypothetical protein
VTFSRLACWLNIDDVDVSGIADAVPLDANNRIEAVVDWKSDVEMSMAKLAGCKAQLCDYRKQTGAKRALLVLMTAGKDLDV